MTTICDHEHRIMLEEMSKTLPGYIPQIAKAKEVLVQLVTLSNKLETNQDELQKETEKENHARTEATLEVQSREDAAKTVAEELSSVGKRRAEQAAFVASLKAQLEEASAALFDLDGNEEKLRQAYSVHESELKERRDRLQNAGVGHSQKLTEFQQQAQTLKLEADQLIGNLRKWRSL
jgi:chromosome segregation ATPase